MYYILTSSSKNSAWQVYWKEEHHTYKWIGDMANKPHSAREDGFYRHDPPRSDDYSGEFECIEELFKFAYKRKLNEMSVFKKNKELFRTPFENCDSFEQFKKGIQKKGIL